MPIDVNTGTRIAETATIERRVAGVMSSGYPKTYSILAAFGSQPAISDNDLAHLTAPQYDARYAAWVAHLQEQEAGLNVGTDKTNEPTDYNTTVCPLPSKILIEAAASEVGGNVAGGGLYDAGAPVTLTATLTDGEKLFIGWRLEGSTEIITKSPIYSFTATENKSFIAVFRYPIVTIGGLDTTGQSAIIGIEVTVDSVIRTTFPSFALDNHFAEVHNIKKGQNIALWLTVVSMGSNLRLCATSGLLSPEIYAAPYDLQVYAGYVYGDVTIYLTTAPIGQNVSGVPVGGYCDEAPVHALSGDGTLTVLPNVGLSNPVTLEILAADIPAGKTFKGWYGLINYQPSSLPYATTLRVVVDISTAVEEGNFSMSEFGGGSLIAIFE